MYAQNSRITEAKLRCSIFTRVDEYVSCIAPHKIVAWSLSKIINEYYTQPSSSIDKIVKIFKRLVKINVRNSSYVVCFRRYDNKQLRENVTIAAW